MLPHKLPVETIERIFFFAFSSDTFSTPNDFLPVTLQAQTSHLLLVSKDLRTFSLPLFYRSITVAKSNDYALFWHPITGLFNREGGEQIARWVKEVKINVAATSRLPIDIPSVLAFYKDDDNRYDRPDNVLVDLQEVPFPNLVNLCFFTLGVEAGRREKKEDYDADVQLERKEKAAGRLVAGDDDVDELLVKCLESEAEEKRKEAVKGLKGKKRKEALEELEDDQWEVESPWDQTSEENLRLERRGTLERLMGQVRNTLTVSMPIHSKAAFDLYRPPTRRDQDDSDPPSLPLTRCPITLFASPSFKFDTSRPYASHYLLLNPYPSYDFAGVPLAFRTWAVSRWKGKELDWRWINEDGTSSSFRE